MVIYIIFFFFQLQIKKILSIGYSDNCEYPIPFQDSSNEVYFLCKEKILLYSTSSDTFILSSSNNDILHSSETGTPLKKENYIITTKVVFASFSFLFHPIYNDVREVLTQNFYLKSNGNICFFQVKTIDGTYYYYATWVDNDSLINFVQFNFVVPGFRINKIIKSNSIRGNTIDCKGFSNSDYSHIICVYVGINGCNANIYYSDIQEDYSQALIKNYNLPQLNINCGITSKVQKIYNINENKFYICYSLSDSNNINNIYCILCEHESTTSIKITSKTNQIILEDCDPNFSDFNIGAISHNYLLVCVKDNNIKYKVFNEDFQYMGEEYTINIGGTIGMPFIVSMLDKIRITYHSYDDRKIGFYDLTPILCTFIPPFNFDINTNINIYGTINDCRNMQIKIFKLPSKGTFKYLNSGSSENIVTTQYYSFIDEAIIFNFQTGGTYSYSFIIYDSINELISDIYSVTITIYTCNESCLHCSTSTTPSDHKCVKCISEYYYLEGRNIDPFNCYNSTTILELTNGYYLTSDSSTPPIKFWKECYRTCKTCIELGNGTEHKCKTCQTGLIFDIYHQNNCVTSCNKYWRRDTDKIEHICIDKCDTDYPYLVIDTNECVSSCINANNNEKIYYYYKEKCYSKCPQNTLPDGLNSKCHEINDFDNFYKGITNYIISVNPPSNIYVYNDNINYAFYNSTENGKKEYKNLIDKYNITYLNLDECLNEIRKSNIIYKNYVFYIALFEFKRNDVMTPQFDFILYNQYGVKHQNEICKNVSVTKSFKNSTLMDYVFEKYKNDSIDILYYSKSNKFYNDICVKCSNDSYDILLEDRYELYHNNSNYYFCEENCNITNIDLENYKVDCVCSNLSSFSEYSQKSYKKYKEEKVIKDKNFQVMKCHISPFTSEFLKKNVGNYVILGSFLIQITDCIIFCINGFKKLALSLEIPINPPSKSLHLKNKNNLNKKSIQNYFNKSTPNEIQKTEEATTNNLNDYDEIKKNKYFVYKVGRSIEEYYNNLKKKYRHNKINFDKKNNNIKNTENSVSDDFSDFSRTTYSDLYCFTIRNKHKIISLFNNGKYDIVVYKISLFILTLSLDIFFCCLFDFNSHIKRLYQKKTIFIGKDEFLIAISSLLCSYFITKIIDCFMEYKSELEDFERKPNKKNDDFEIKIKSKIECKIIIFFILSFLLTGVTWYFVSVFFQIYSSKKTLINLSLCLVCNFIISFIIPFIYYSIVNCLEYIAISKENQCLYDFAMFLLKF